MRKLLLLALIPLLVACAINTPIIDNADNGHRIHNMHIQQCPHYYRFIWEYDIPTACTVIRHNKNTGENYVMNERELLNQDLYLYWTSGGEYTKDTFTVTFILTPQVGHSYYFAMTHCGDQYRYLYFNPRIYELGGNE